MPLCPKCSAQMVRDCGHYFCLMCGKEVPAEVNPHPPEGLPSWPKQLNPRHEKHTHQEPEGE